MGPSRSPGEPTTSRAGAIASVLLGAVLFGTTGTSQALGPDSSTPLAVGATRIAIGGLALMAVALAVGAFRRRQRDPRWSPAALFVGAAGVAGYQLAFFAAVRSAGVAVGTLVAIGSAPILVGILDALLNRRRPGRWWFLATAIAVGGVALLSLQEGPGSAQPRGIVLALLAGASYAAYTMSSKRLLDHGHRPMAVMAATFGLAAVLLAPVLFVEPLGWLAHPRGAGMVLFLGVCSTAIAYILFARGLEVLRPPTVATLTLMEPVTATLLGVLMLQERLSARSLAGIALVGIALALLLGRDREVPAARSANDRRR